LADGPLPEWLAGMAGGAASLSTLIPIAGPLAKGGTAARAAGSLLTVGGSAAAGAAVQESVLQATQRTRTAEESAASILGAFLLGGVLGSAAGALSRPEVKALGAFLGEARPRIETEITTMIRSAGLGDFPPPRTNLYDGTAVSRFLDADNSPNFKLQRVYHNELTDRDLLNHVGEQQPKLLDNVTKAMKDVEVLQDRIDRLSADPTLFSRAPTIRDKPTLDLLATLDKEGTPAAKARAAQIREGAQPAVTLNRLLDEMDEATAKWEKAEAKLAKVIKDTRDTIDEIGGRIGAPERGQISGEIADMYQKMKAALEEGKDPLAIRPKDPMAWLEGFAKFPGDKKAQTVSFISGKKIVGAKGGFATKYSLPTKTGKPATKVVDPRVAEVSAKLKAAQEKLASIDAKTAGAKADPTLTEKQYESVGKLAEIQDVFTPATLVDGKPAAKKAMFIDPYGRVLDVSDMGHPAASAKFNKMIGAAEDDEGALFNSGRTPLVRIDSYFAGDTNSFSLGLQAYEGGVTKAQKRVIDAIEREVARMERRGDEVVYMSEVVSDYGGTPIGKIKDVAVKGDDAAARAKAQQEVDALSEEYAAARAKAQQEVDALSEEYAAPVSANVETPKAGETPEAKDLSAAAVGAGPGYSPVYKDINRLRSSGKAAEVSAWLKKIGMASPAIELSMSRFEAARDGIQRLVYTGMTTEGHFQGVAAPPDLHTEIARLGNPLMLQVERIAAKGFDAYKVQAKAGLVPPLNRLQFNEAVAKAMTEGDQGPHQIISDTAKAYRVIDDKLKDLAVEYKVGVFKDGNPKVNDKSHLYRAWAPEKIRTNQSGFRALAQDYFIRNGADADDAAEAASEVMHKILGSPEGRLVPEIKVSEGRGSLKERTFKIPDDFVTGDGRYSTKDFVDRNVVNVMAQYVRTLSSDIAYKKILDGDKGVADMIDAMKREAEAMVDALPDARKNGPDEKKIMNDFDRESRVLTETIHRIRGTDPTPMDPRYAGLRSASKMMRDFNVIRVMGSSIISQLPDLARPMVVHGFAKVFGSMLGDFTDGFKMVKLGKAEAQRLGTATDMVLAGRAGQIADLSEQVTRQSKAEMVTGIAAHKALTLFGVSPWTVYQKARVSYLATDDMLRQIEKIGKGQDISDKWRTALAGLGIDKDTALAIYKEQPNWEEASRGFWVANTEKWKDQVAANKFSDALLRHIDNMIISPTAADRPLWTQTEVGRAVSQFQGFGWATHQRILISGLQDRDAGALTSVAAMMALGMISVAMRDIVAEGQVKERDVRGWLREGFDRSGVASRFMETDAMVKKAVGTSPVTALSGGQTERSASRGFVGQALGSTAGLVDDTAKAVRGLMDGSVTGADVHNLRRVAPLQNFILFRGILDQAEENLVQHYGLKPRQTPQ
jgi:hypothetical protein